MSDLKSKPKTLDEWQNIIKAQCEQIEEDMRQLKSTIQHMIIVAQREELLKSSVAFEKAMDEVFKGKK